MTGGRIQGCPWQYDDGGRAAAGFKGQTGDCVTRAIAIALDEPYRAIYDTMNFLGTTERISKRRRAKSSARGGVYRPTLRRYLKSRGWTWVPTMFIGQGCKTHLRAGELPSGRLIVGLSRHIVAVIDGVVHDTGDPSRGGYRCVYGYWLAPLHARIEHIEHSDSSTRTPTA